MPIENRNDVDLYRGLDKNLKVRFLGATNKVENLRDALDKGEIKGKKLNTKQLNTVVTWYSRLVNGEFNNV